MNLTVDPQQFDKLQEVLVNEMASAIKIKLIEAGLDSSQIADLTGSITFSIANLIDDLAAIESDGEEVRPYLTFRNGDEDLVHCGENSCTNTFVYDVLKKHFG